MSGTLWFNSDESRASASLRSALWRLPRCPDGSRRLVAHPHLAAAKVTIDLSEVMERGMAVLRCRTGLS